LARSIQWPRQLHSSSSSKLAPANYLIHPEVKN
jgi:hypothetical protein